MVRGRDVVMGRREREGGGGGGGGGGGRGGGGGEEGRGINTHIMKTL